MKSLLSWCVFGSGYITSIYTDVIIILLLLKMFVPVKSKQSLKGESVSALSCF